MAGKDRSKAVKTIKNPKKPSVKPRQGSQMKTRKPVTKGPAQDKGVSGAAASGKREAMRQARAEIAAESESLARQFAQGGKEATPGVAGRPRRRWKRVLIKLLAAINAVLLVAVVIAFGKPVWVGQVKGWFSPPPKRAAVYRRPPFRPNFNRPITQRPQIAGRTMPPAQVPQGVIRPQAGIPRGAGEPPSVAPAAPPVQGQDLDEYLEVGALYAEKGRYKQAEELFKKVTQGNPSSAQGHNNLGFVYLKQGKYEVAEREFKESLRLDPASALANYNLACLYSRKGQTAESLIYLNRALKKDARVKSWAMTDNDFDQIRSDVVFQELIGASASKATPQKQKEVQRQEGVQKPVEPQKPAELQKQAVPQKPIEPQQQAEPAKPLELRKQLVPQQPVEPPKAVEPQKQEGQQGGSPNQEGANQGGQGGTTQ